MVVGNGQSISSKIWEDWVDAGKVLYNSFFLLKNLFSLLKVLRYLGADTKWMELGMDPMERIIREVKNELLR